MVPAATPTCSHDRHKAAFCVPVAVGIMIPLCRSYVFSISFVVVVVVEVVNVLSSHCGILVFVI